ncbi:malate:quinone oxidoreductase family protein [Collimonas fungivorans]|uniref:Malate:quinone oxidoreductase family protein n=1 Tax=Collimonas fungivorans TaxID=158899 RepID=A0A127PC93_9BURK|nr:malate:quinone oxidoreductase [Collimonas fungivorans]AMO95295.1 malate:quinone oxidoreductase family protein [Collimonas fungivorans]
MDDKSEVHITQAIGINENFQISRQFWSHKFARSFPLMDKSSMRTRSCLRRHGQAPLKLCN